MALSLLLVCCCSSVAFAQCAVDSDKLYKLFTDYREQINTASKPEDLSAYFSENFNAYFTNKMNTARNETTRGHYLTQYWDNLNTAKDIVIVFDYTLTCDNNSANLALVSILSSNGTTEGREVELWNVAIKYLREDRQWKIDSFAYERLGSNQRYLATDIKNNFVLIR
ncbi:hypothetical protein [Kaarinaea lacus]